MWIEVDDCVLVNLSRFDEIGIRKIGDSYQLCAWRYERDAEGAGEMFSLLDYENEEEAEAEFTRIKARLSGEAEL